MTDHTQSFLNAPILPTLIRMATPQAMGFFVQSSVSIAEIYFIGQLGTTSLAAMALVFPLMMLIQMLSGGAMGGAVTGVIARTLGAGNMERAEALLWHVVYLAIGLGLLMTLVYLLAGDQILRLLGGEDAVLAEALAYIAILFPGSTLMWLANMLQGVVRGTGNMKLPALMMVISAFIQVPLSACLILGLGPFPMIGLQGAAISILAVNLVNVCLLLFLHGTGRLRIRFNRKQAKYHQEYVSTILSVGAIASFSPFFTVFTILFMTALVGSFGTAALAGYGIAARVEFLVVPLVFGLGVSMNAMAGSCIGAGDFDRAERIGWVGSFTAGAITGFLGIFLALFPEFWIQIFSDDPATIDVAASYFTITAPFFGFLGMGLALYFASQGAGAVGWPVIATTVRFIVAVGGGWLFAQWYGDIEHIFMCISAGMLIYCAGTSGALYLGTWRRGTQ